MPSCAFTPAAKWCFTSVISVTRSAASISSGLAFRPVTIDMQIGPARFQCRDNALERKIVVAERDVQLVENDEVEARIGHQLLRLAPSALGRRDVAAEILRLPGEALAHGVPGDLIAELGQRVALGRMPGALDELHHADPLAAAEHAQRKPERRRGLALAGAGMDDQQALLDGLARHLLVLRAPCGSPSWRDGARLACRRSVWSWAFHCDRQARDHHDHARRLRRQPLVEDALQRRGSGGPAHCQARCRGRPRWRRARSDRPCGPAPPAVLPFARRCRSVPSIRFDSQSVRQSTSTAASAGAAIERVGKSVRRLDRSASRQRALPCARRCARPSRRPSPRAVAT